MGIDIASPLTQGPDKVKFLLVLTNYFNKWVELGAYKKTEEREVVDFIWYHIIC